MLWFKGAVKDPFQEALFLNRAAGAALSMSESGETRSPQACPEALLGTSVDLQIPDAIVAAATYGRSVPLTVVSRRSKVRIQIPFNQR